MLSPRSAPVKRLIIIGLVMAISYIAFATIIEGAKKDAASGDTMSMINSVSITELKAKLNFAGAVITVPAPEGYCFLLQEQEVDAIALKLVRQAQDRYGNYLWAVFVKCDDLDKMRSTKNLNAYTNTGVIITPAQLADKPIKAEIFAKQANEQISLFNSADVQAAVNKARNSAGNKEAQVGSTKPEIYYNEPGAMMFTVTHTMPAKADPITTTEFEIMTAVKDRALVAIFKTGKLEDKSDMKQATKNYLEDLRAAN